MRRRTAPIVVALCAMLSLVACNLQQGQQEPATPTPVPTPIIPTKPTYTVQKGSVVRQVQFTGRIGPVKEVELFFKVGGRVRTVKVQRDDTVKQGDLIADLEIDPLERQVAQSELDLERVQVNLDRAQKASDAAIARAQIEYSISALNYDKIKNQDVVPQRLQAEAALESARLNVNAAQAAFDSGGQHGGSPEAMALERATLDFKTAKAIYDAAIAQITTGRQDDLNLAAKQIALSANSLDTAKQGVDPLLVNDVKRADLALKNLKAEVADAQIVAPFNGKVTSLLISEGSPVEAFVSSVVIADPSALEVNADANSTVLTELKETMVVTVALVSSPEKPMLGKIRQLPYPYGSGGATNATTTASNVQKDTSTRVSLDPASLQGTTLALGDLARITVDVEKVNNVLWLPPQAVRTFEGRKFVVIQDGSGQRRVDVTVGVVADDRVEVKTGLQEGQVAVAP
jgi:multidrug efflux pump subunit AcrA (membrane-fusion protein)